MMDLQTIRELSEDASKRAKRNKTQPVVNVGTGAGEGVPFIGRYVPKGWKRANLEDLGLIFGDRAIYEDEGDGAIFVDTSGWGGPGEPALTIPEFVALTKKLQADNPDKVLGFGLIEHGQFQGHVAVYEKA